MLEDLAWAPEQVKLPGRRVPWIASGADSEAGVDTPFLLQCARSNLLAKPEHHVTAAEHG